MVKELSKPLLNFVILLIVGVIAFQIIDNLDDDFVAGSYADNASTEANAAIWEFFDWVTLIALVIVAGYLLLIVRQGGLSQAV